MRAGIAICEQHRMTASRRRYVCKPLHLARDRHLIDPGGPRRALERTLGIIRDDLDARTKHVGLTDRGSALLAQLLPGYFAIIAEEMEATE